jgi:HAD superfamily hydrolase (TIGR01549 family)
VTLTLLLDLDDTLLTNNMDTFLPAYFQALASYMEHHETPENLINTLINAARGMIANDRPDRTLKETFDEAFYPILGLNAEQVKEEIDNFYLKVFPTLQPLTKFRPDAYRLVEDAIERNFELVIATNPLFPKLAIEERIRWAGISIKEIPITLITSYETFHFSKPNLAYYAEILARLGWPDRAALMVGDDLINDIQPARQLGIPAFWIKPDEDLRVEEDHPKPLVSGAINKVIPWLDNTSFDLLQPTINNPEAYLAVLKSTPACLLSFLKEIPSEIWQKKPEEGEWCLTEILCHLRDVEKEVNLPRLRKIIAETNPFLPGMDTDPWADERQYIRQDGKAALDEFVQARLEYLHLLSNLNTEEWTQSVRHAIFGPTQLIELVKINSSHDRVHVRQLHQVLNMRPVIS